MSVPCSAATSSRSECSADAPHVWRPAGANAQRGAHAQPSSVTAPSPRQRTRVERSVVPDRPAVWLLRKAPLLCWTPDAFLSALPRDLENGEGRLLFATNAGMFDSNHKPVELVHANQKCPSAVS